MRSGRGILTRLTEAQRAQLEALRQSYRAELPAKLQLIGGAVETLSAGGWEKSHLMAFYELVHKLAGSAAIYGFGGISRAAGEIESWALAALDDGIPEQKRPELSSLMGALLDAFAASEPDSITRRRSPSG
jgi:HPt (histidine-containing phosphotransfer) domain-containing protein